VIPYHKLTAGPEQPPFLLGPDEDAGVIVVEPCAVLDGAVVAVFFEAREKVGGAGLVYRMDSPDGGMNFGRPRVALEPEAGRLRVGAPSVVIGPDGVWTMAVELDDEAGVALATSVDGHTFEMGETVLTPAGQGEEGGVGGPSLLSGPDGLELYYHARPLVEGAPGRASIHLARRSGEAFVREGVVLGPGQDCLGADGAAEDCWDAGGVESPEVKRSSVVGTGRQLKRMMFTGVGADPKNVGVGFAASRDGVSWSSFEINPVLAETRRESGPSNIMVGETFILYFTDRVNARFGIGLAVSEADNPSERF
jgi:hypothetical protein